MNSERSLPRRISLLGLIVCLMFLLFPLSWIAIEQRFDGVSDGATSLIFHPVDIGFLLLLLGYLAYNPKPATKPATPLTRPLVALMLLTLISVAWAFDLTLALQMALQIGILLAVFLLIQWLKPSDNLVQWTLLSAVTLQASVAVAQFLRQDDLGWSRLGEIALDRYPGGGSILAVGDTFWLRAYGLSGHPNILAGFLATATLLLLGASLVESRSAWVFRVGVGLASAALLLTFSRSAWLGLIIGFACLAILIVWQKGWWPQYGRPFLIGSTILILAVVVAAWPTRELISSRFAPMASRFEQRSVAERGTLLSASLELYRLAPLTGVGAGNAAVGVAPLVSDLPDVSAQPVHNVPLLLLVELGPAGALLWLWLMLLPAVHLLLLIRRQPSVVTPWLVALTAALIVFAVTDLYDYYSWGWSQGRYWRWLLWALWARAVT